MLINPSTGLQTTYKAYNKMQHLATLPPVITLLSETAS